MISEGVKLEAFADILRREADPVGVYVVADRIAASGAMSKGTATRWMRFILGTERMGRDGLPRHQELVSIDQADKVLTALDLNYLWHTELADAIVKRPCGHCGGPQSERTPGCSACHERHYRRQRRRKCAAVVSLGGTNLEEAA